MATLHTINLIVHIISGFTALTTGIVPMVSQKGSKVHRTWGTVYFWAMAGVSITAIGSFLMRPDSPFFQYLMLIAFFSFHLTLTGVRTLNMKKQADKPARFDWAVAGLAVVIGVVATLHGGWQLYRSLVQSAPFSYLSVLYIVFGLVFLLNGRSDLAVYRGIRQREKMHWFFHHIARMVGAYIATVTAFFVVNSQHFPLVPPLLVWTLPGLIGGFGIARWTRYYRAKFNAGRPINA